MSDNKTPPPTSTATPTAPAGPAAPHVPGGANTFVYAFGDNGQLLMSRSENGAPRSWVVSQHPSARAARTLLEGIHANTMAANPNSRSRTGRNVRYNLVIVRGGKGIVHVQLRDATGNQRQVPAATLNEQQLTLVRSVWAGKASPVDVAALRAARTPAKAAPAKTATP